MVCIWSFNCNAFNPNNPNGIESFSPGLALRLPWVLVPHELLNPNGVASFLGHGCNPDRVPRPYTV